MPKPAKPNPIKLHTAKQRLPMRHLRGRAAALLDAGASPEEVARAIADVIDRLLAFEAMIPGPLALVLEAIDGPIAHAIALAIVRGVVKAGERAARVG